ncbi:MAG: hypothetical protein ACI9OJ_002633 [Myxococcota bacterium]|jgi:hypothetical protein
MVLLFGCPGLTRRAGISARLASRRDSGAALRLATHGSQPYTSAVVGERQIPTEAPSSRLWIALVLALTIIPNTGVLENEISGDDEYNALLEAELFLAGESPPNVRDGSYLTDSNVQRLLPFLSFVGRYVAFDTHMISWRGFQLLLHAINAVMVMLLARRLGMREPAQVLAALLFAWSQHATQSVDWFGGSYDLMATFGLGLALIGHHDRRTWMALLGLAIAFTSKETGLMVLPALVVWSLATEKWRGILVFLRRFWAYAALIGPLVGLRIAQVVGAGSVENAGLPLRSVSFDAATFFGAGGRTVLAALASPIMRVEADVDEAAFGSAIVLAIGLAVWRSRALAVRVGLLLLIGWIMIIPVLLMNERGEHMDAGSIFFNSRYVYASYFVLAPIIPAVLMGLRDLTRSPSQALRWGGGALAAALGITAALQGVDIGMAAVRNDGRVLEMREAMQRSPAVAGSQAWVVMLRPDPNVEAFLLSGWWAHVTGAHMMVVDGSRWRIRTRVGTGRQMDRDMMHTHALTMAFAPELMGPNDQLWAVDPVAEQAVRQVPASAARAPGEAHSVTTSWSPGRGVCPSLVRGSTHFRECVAGDPNSDASDVRSSRLDWPMATVNQLRVDYTVKSEGAERNDEPLRLVLIWHGVDERGHAASVRTSFPTAADGQRHVESIIVWLNPELGQLSTVTHLGLDVEGGDGELFLNRLTRVANR